MAVMMDHLANTHDPVSCEERIPIEQAREEIDRIDREMAILFEERFQAVSKIAAYKKAGKLPVLDAEREKKVLLHNTEYIQNEEIKPYYRQFLQNIMDLSKEYQKSSCNL